MFEKAQPGGLNVAIVSTYPPRACGLATFASDLADSLRTAVGVKSVGIIAIERLTDSETVQTSGEATPYVARIRDDACESYELAAKQANRWADVVLVQHEFGIFGGDDGSYLLHFLNGLSVPYVITLHTVLPMFSSSQTAVLKQACVKAAATCVFTSTASRLVADQEIASESQIVVIPHGAPDAIYAADRCTARNSLDVADRFVLSSFGLLSAGKGLELAIEALPLVADQIPNVQLLLAGRTHPDVVRRDGESYRESLKELAKSLGVAERVTFIDGFMSIEAVADILAVTDVFVTPYVNLNQIVSGALTFALASGCPIVSTPYLYAVDQLADGGGTIVEGRLPNSFAAAICELGSDEHRMTVRRRATEIGKLMRWSAVGERVALLAANVSRPKAAAPHLSSSFQLVPVLAPSIVDLTMVVSSPGPAVALARSELPTRHLRRLVDDRGIIQHATGVVPLLSSGYCIDDIARVIPVAKGLVAVHEASETANFWEGVFARSISALADAHRPDSHLMKNFMTWSGEWIDQPHFGDHVGRALLGLSSVPNDPAYFTVVGPLAASLLLNWPGDSPLHPDSYALIAQGLAPHLLNEATARGMLKRLTGAYDSNANASWRWPEATVRYDQGRFPQALLVGGRLLEDPLAIERGLECLQWLTAQCDQQTYLRFPGHRGWTKAAPLQWSGDEQPLEALAFIEAHLQAYEITHDSSHEHAALRGLDWFYGANRLGQSLAEPLTGSCYDGLGSYDVNRNCGAESTLALLQAHQAIDGFRRSARSSSQPANV